MDHETWEGIAREALEATWTDAPVDAFSLAGALDVEVREYDGPEAFVDLFRRCIYLPRRAMRPERRHGAVAHELGHVLLRDHREDHQNERAARYLAGALLVPRESLDRALRRSWSIRVLRSLHPNASHEMLARRVAQVRPAVATVIDGGRVTARVASPWLAGREVARDVRVWELGLIARALDEGEVFGDEPTVATHAGGDRVVCVTRRWWAAGEAPDACADAA